MYIYVYIYTALFLLKKMPCVCVWCTAAGAFFFWKNALCVCDALPQALFFLKNVLLSKAELSLPFWKMSFFFWVGFQQIQQFTSKRCKFQIVNSWSFESLLGMPYMRIDQSRRGAMTRRDAGLPSLTGGWIKSKFWKIFKIAEHPIPTPAPAGSKM